MKNKKQNIILEDQQDDSLFKKTKSNLNIFLKTCLKKKVSQDIYQN